MIFSTHVFFFSKKTGKQFQLKTALWCVRTLAGTSPTVTVHDSRVGA